MKLSFFLLLLSSSSVITAFASPNTGKVNFGIDEKELLKKAEEAKEAEAQKEKTDYTTHLEKFSERFGLKANEPTTKFNQKEIDMEMIAYQSRYKQNLREPECVLKLQFRQLKSEKTSKSSKYVTKKKCQQYIEQDAELIKEYKAKVEARLEAYAAEESMSQTKIENVGYSCFKEKKEEACGEYQKLLAEHDKEYNTKYHSKISKVAQEKINFDAAKCTWAIDYPRRVVSTKSDCDQGEGAKKLKEAVCVGYVVCPGENGINHLRMSTCAPENCGADDAVKCTQQPGYGSKHKGEFFSEAKGKTKVDVDVATE